MNIQLFKKSVRWFIILAIVHLISMILAYITISSSMPYIVEEAPHRVIPLVLSFNIIFDAVFVLIYTKIETSYIDYRKSIKEMLKSGEFSLLDHFKKVYLKEHLIETLLFFIFQLPFVIFFAIWGVELQYPTTFEQFYFMDIGCYALTGSAIFGWLLNTLMFGGIFTLLRIFIIHLTKKSVEKDLNM